MTPTAEMPESSQHPRATRIGVRVFAGGVAVALADTLAGCEDEREADATSRLCESVDPTAAEAITGDADLTGFGGGNLDATRRRGNALARRGPVNRSTRPADAGMNKDG
ncbi:hypothetical protein KV102_01085 [Mumia sp. zg.B53]|uniref:hypothetical protein n=1 Tax=unclassified Mumia TaxID=2621872 RepID=UPI001C6EF200|nr:MULTISPECIES: hypothetical protein [unclassified Mumia]MBW9205188.1 hypothetical protein [Mumia sp. zg.B17]MBW9208811.1 hypothetical protein [Mumia sp. zg.B21]MBW9213422.1 hypothetical protein [Mumia sp. zg.B53]